MKIGTGDQTADICVRTSILLRLDCVSPGYRMIFFCEGSLMDIVSSGHQPITSEIVRLFAERGNSQYGHEAVSQLEHALQAACFAEQSGADAALIAAALLHDVGHLLHNLSNDAPERGIDDHHETIAARWLQSRFPASLVEPVRLHVAAKRYLCTVTPDYLQQLSAPSILSLELQGGTMSEGEVQKFASCPHCDTAIALRRWDDAAKIPQMTTPTLDHFAQYVDEVLLRLTQESH